MLGMFFHGNRKSPNIAITSTTGLRKILKKFWTYLRDITPKPPFLFGVNELKEEKKFLKEC